MPPRVALLHHWFVTRGGGERVAECLAALLPTAEIFSLVTSPAGIPASMRERRIHTSLLQRIPGGPSHHRHLLPLYPEAARSLDLRHFDLVVSSDSGPVKAARIRPGTPHLCYCHSPMRYLYDSFDSYRASMGQVARTVFSAAVPRVRRADLEAAEKVTEFVANSRYVADRIQRFYGRESTVIHPPIDLHRARRNAPGEHYLAAGRLVPYKRTELMIEACERLGRPLRIAGAGPEEARLRRIAGPNTTFLGELDTESLWNEYSRCRALLFAADEDFGMVPLEAQACGRPVIAFGKGGSLETVRGLSTEAARTGVFYPEQTADSLAGAILEFEANLADFDSENCQAHAARFATPVFLHGMRNEIARLMPAAEEVLASTETALAAIA